MLIEKLYLENLLSFDKLHFKEIKIINDLHDLLLKNDKENVEKKFGELVKDVEHHFETEEREMFEYWYSWANKHQYIHGCALQTLYEIHNKWKEDRINESVINYLEKRLLPWFNCHVTSCDKDACEFLLCNWSN